jgi:transposase
MEVTNHSLSQITAETLDKLSHDELLYLSNKLLKDLKEARDRLNQNPSNSSKPSGSMPPWEKGGVDKSGEADVDAEDHQDSEGQTANDTEEDQPGASEETQSANDNAGASSANGVDEGEPPFSSDTPKPERKKPGKQEGAPGYGRVWNPECTEAEIHCHPMNCTVCGQELDATRSIAYTQYKQVDIKLGHDEISGLQVLITPYTLYTNHCQHCEHDNRYEPRSSVKIDPQIWGDVQLSQWRMIGPNLAAFIVHLKMEFRLPIRKIQGLLMYFGIPLSVGVIQQCYEEAGIAVSSLENDLVAAVVSEALVHADETAWLEKAQSLWLWIFMASSVVYFCVGRRTKELVSNVLSASFQGWLMSDGYGAYRHYEKRLRCWAHLLRKAKGLAESTDTQAVIFGKLVLNLMQACMSAIYQWREEHPSIKEGTIELTTGLQPLLEAFKMACEKYGGNGVSHDKTKALAREFLNDWDTIFRVLEHPSLPLTNNEAERGLRPWVLLRKICYGSKSSRGTKVFALLASIMQTCKKRSVCSMQFMAKAIASARNGEAISLP